MKKILKALLVLIGMIAMLFVVAVIVNLSIFDEELLPEVQAIKDIKAEPYQAGNAYPAIIAMSYYPEESYQAATSKIRNRLNNNISGTGKDFLSESDDKSLQEHEINGSDLVEYTRCHTRKEKNCVEKYISNLNKRPITSQDTQILLNRYAQLINYRQFDESTQMKFNTPLPPLSTPLRAQRVFLLTQWLKNKTNFVPLFFKDLNFWRMMLNESHLLITKMIANAAIHNDIQILAYAIKTGYFSKSELTTLQNQITRLTKNEQSLSLTFQSEMKGAMGFFQHYTNESQDFMGRLLYQPQATVNLHYKTNINYSKILDNLNAQAYYQSKSSETWPENPKSKSALSLYNPTGKLFLKTSFAPLIYQDYFARMRDLDSMLALLKLRIELALNSDQNIMTLIKNSKHKNPYTDQPFDYYTEAKTIGFDCLDRTSVCEIAL